MKEINDKKNIKMGVILSYAGMGVSVLCALFISNRVLNYIGDYNYGLYSFVTSIVTWLNVVSTALTASFLRYTTIEAVEKEGDVGRTNAIYHKMLLLLAIIIFVLGIIILGVMYTNKICIGKYSWKDSQLMYHLFGLSVFNIGLTMGSSVYSLYIIYKKRFAFSKLISIFVTIINFLGQFLIAYFLHSVIYIAAFAIVVTTINLCINAGYCYRYLDIRFSKVKLRDNSRLVKSIFVFSSILLFNSIVDQINTNVDKTLLGIYSKPEYITIYQMAQQLASYFVLMSVSVSGVFAPSINEYISKKENEKINILYLKISKWQSIILCCAAFGFVSCGRNFVIWWLGEERIMSFYVAATLMILNLGPLTLNSSIEIQRALNKHRFRAVVYFLLAIANIGISILLLNILDSEYSVYACLIGTVLTTICSHWIAMNIYNHKVIGLPIKKYLGTLLKYMCTGMVCCLVVFCFEKSLNAVTNSILLRFFAQGLVFITLYGIMILILNRNQVYQYMRKKGR